MVQYGMAERSGTKSATLLTAKGRGKVVLLAPPHASETPGKGAVLYYTVLVCRILNIMIEERR